MIKLKSSVPFTVFQNLGLFKFFVLMAFLLTFEQRLISQICEPLLQYGIYDYSSTFKEDILIKNYAETMSKTKKTDFDGKYESLMPVGELPIPSSLEIGFKYSSNSDFYKQVQDNLEKRNKYIKYVKSVNPNILDAYIECIKELKSKPFLVYASHYSTDLSEITINVQYNVAGGINDLECSINIDTTNFSLLQSYKQKFIVKNHSNGGVYLKIRRLKNTSFTIIIQSSDGVHSAQIVIPDIVPEPIIPEPKKEYIKIYEGIVHNCNGHYLSNLRGFKLPGTQKNCDKDRPAREFGKLALQNNVGIDNLIPVYVIPDSGILTLERTGSILGYISEKPIDNGLPIYSTLFGSLLRTKEEKEAPKRVGYMFPLDY